VKVTLEKASEIDSERLAEISKRAFDTDVDFGAPGNVGPPGYDSLAFYARILRFLDSYCIMRGEDIAGGVMAKVVGKHGILERIFIDPSLMRGRIGTEAMQLIEEAYPEVSLWSLGTPEWNTRTRQFFGKLGYTQVGWEHSEPDNRGRWYDKRKERRTRLLRSVTYATEPATSSRRAGLPRRECPAWFTIRKPGKPSQ
jgi:hypothetical protein